MENSQDYTIPDSIVGKATIDQLKYILDRAEKRFTDSRKSNESVTIRSTTLIGFLVTILLALSGFLIEEIIKNGDMHYRIIITVGFGIIYVYSIFFYVKSNIKSVILYYEGTPPKNLLTSIFITDDKDIKYMYETE